MQTGSLQRGKTNDCLGYDSKQSDDDTLELWGMESASVLPLLPGPLWLGVVAPVRVPSISQIGLFNHLLNMKLFNCMQTIDYY